MADRHPDHVDLGRVRDQLFRHDCQAPRAAFVRRDLVLHRHDLGDRCVAHRQQPGDPGFVDGDEVVLRVRRCARRVHAVVVWTQRGCVLSNHAVPRAHVLLLAESGGAPGVQLPTFDRALLDDRVHLHLGRSAPPALLAGAGMGREPRHVDVADSVDAQLGGHAQRFAHFAWRVAQGRAGSDPQVLCRRRDVLRHEHLRRPDAVDQDGQRVVALHRLDDCARARGRARLERNDDLWHGLLADAASVSDRRHAQQKADGPALLDGHSRHSALRRDDLWRGPNPGPDVARVQRRRLAGVPRLP